jgi:hypothetical protein
VSTTSGPPASSRSAPRIAASVIDAGRRPPGRGDRPRSVGRPPRGSPTGFDEEKIGPRAVFAIVQ